MRKYRAKLKENPALYRARKEEEKMRSLMRRETATDEQKSIARDLAKKWMQQMRESRK